MEFSTSLKLVSLDCRAKAKTSSVFLQTTPVIFLLTTWKVLVSYFWIGKYLSNIKLKNWWGRGKSKGKKCKQNMIMYKQIMGQCMLLRCSASIYRKIMTLLTFFCPVKSFLSFVLTSNWSVLKNGWRASLHSTYFSRKLLSTDLRPASTLTILAISFRELSL